MNTVTEKILSMPERVARPKRVGIWTYIFTDWKIATAFSVALGLYVWGRVWSLNRAADLHFVPWIRVVGLELFLTILLLFTFGAIYASYKRKFGVPGTYIARNRSEIRKK